MTLLQGKRKLVVVEDNDSSSEDTDIKDKIKSDSDSSNSAKESENDENNSESESDNENEVQSGDEGGNEDSGDEGENEDSGEENENSGVGDVDSDGDQPENNAGWADSVAKILKTKKPKNKRTLVLSKAKKLTDVVKKEKPTEIGFQIDGEIKEEKPDLSILEKLKTEEEPLKKKRKEISTVRVKPNILDKDRERTLAKIATRGVVQLFNSVRMQQKDIDNKLQEAGPLERKRENAMKNIDKRAFLDVLMQKKSQPVDGEVKNETTIGNKKKEPKAEPSWSVLRDDFMMGAKMKDWDKEEEEDSGNEANEFSDSD